MAKNYIQRGEWYHYTRRVPKHLSAYDKRTHVRITLKTKDEKEAAKLANIYDDFIEKYWRDLIKSGQPDSDFQKFSEARSMAKAHGFAYKDFSEVLTSPLEEVLSRIEAITDNPKIKSKGLLGTVRAANLTINECPERFWPLCADRLVGRSDNQKRKYKEPRVAAIKAFVNVVGNLDLGEIDRSHVLEFRTWLMERVAKSEITGNTANKQIGNVKDMLITVGRHCEIDTNFKLLFAETRLAEDVESRPPFETSFIQNTLLNGKSFEGLNEDARMLVYMMIETGARESEIIGLSPDDFFLDRDVPYIWIRKNDIRSLKTKTSERQIPLVGISLLAARKISTTGILRYQKNPDSASATINKYLRENELKPTSKHTLYSLRHSFKDRLRDSQAPEEVIDELMGHKKAGPKYGRGHLLEAKHEWLTKIVLDHRL
ncbi:tyrosine-type recombinase/integrase [Puniceicoccaceae bacterium K14]|nr:tyrosine-type recombinase/integrase [Puniceicoccaceae bacterium K14]